MHAFTLLSLKSYVFICLFSYWSEGPGSDGWAAAAWLPSHLLYCLGVKGQMSAGVRRGQGRWELGEVR